MKFLILILSAITLSFPAMAQDAAKDSTFDQVMRTQTMRCGYFLWPPFLEKDMATGKMRGIFHDLTEELGKQLSLKIVWQEEVSNATMFEGYNSGRYDLICGPLAVVPARARASDFTDPIVFAPTYLYARADDKRFDGNFAAANDPGIKFSVMDGEFSQIIAQEVFPKATPVSVMNLSDSSALFMDVASGKSDVTAAEPILADIFMKNNPGKLKRVEGGPIRTLPVAMSVPPGDYRFRRMIDLGLRGMHDSGFIDRLFKSYLPADLDFYRVDRGYLEKTP